MSIYNPTVCPEVMPQQIAELHAKYLKERDRRIKKDHGDQYIVASGKWKDPIVTEIVDAGPWTKAEDYHQDYYRKNPIRYRYYRASCGRDARVAEVWQDRK